VRAELRRARMVIVSRMTPEEARTLAERLYAGRLDRYGSPLVGHVRRVTAEVPVEACAVAWLHEALEYAVATAEELCAAGATEAEVGAVGLLTRDLGGGEAAHLAHVARRACAPDEYGELARSVKRADLIDRATPKATGRGVSSTPPNPHALEILGAAWGCARTTDAGEHQSLSAMNRTDAGTGETR